MATIELGGVAIPESALTWSFVRASDPGGQNVNKFATAAECRLDLDLAGFDQDCPPALRMPRRESFDRCGRDIDQRREPAHPGPQPGRCARTSRGADRGCVRRAEATRRHQGLLPRKRPSGARTSGTVARSRGSPSRRRTTDRRLRTRRRRSAAALLRRPGSVPRPTAAPALVGVATPLAGSRAAPPRR